MISVGFPRSRTLLLALATCQFALADEGSRDINFARDVQPLLTEHCAACHGGVRKSGGFSVLSRQSLLSTTDSDVVPVVPGSPEDSELLRRIAATDPDERMPPDGHDALSAEQIRIVRTWIKQGASWPQHWAWAPVVPPGIPAEFDSHSIDLIVRQKLKTTSLQPSPVADRRTLLRRLSLDLTGLLPTPDVMREFVQDASDEAYSRQVSRLLSSPHFGERWARHWLDEARYADSEGYEKDTPKEDAYHFRNWVIQSINEDMPFDQFTIRQIAGDLLPSRTNKDLIATKFHLQTQFNLEGGVDAEEDRTKRVIDQINTIGTVWLGTSIGCCQCHDHPYDALAQREFFGLYAFFNNTDFDAILPSENEATADDKIHQRSKKWNELAELLEQQVGNKNLSNSVQAQLTQLRKFDNSNGFVRFLTARKSSPRPTYAFHRGDFLQPDRQSGIVRPDTPGAFPPLTPRTNNPDRLDLANWLVDDANPLVARVTVNKVWLHLFGQPIVDQPQDFGSRGGKPSNPDLLDALSHWFVNEGQWSRKDLIRLIVMSQTYQQSSVFRQDIHEIDPDNRLLARQNRFRVEAEIIRDIALQTSGLLSNKVGGPSVFPPLPAIVAKQTYANSNHYQVSEGDDRYRRGMYTFFRRTAIDPNLLTFDCPDSSIARPQRDRSNNPLQALALLHNEVFLESAQHFAKRILDDEPSTDGERIDRAFEYALCRRSTRAERETLLSLLTESRHWYHKHQEAAKELVGRHHQETAESDEQAAWVATLRVILNLDEFVTRN